MTRILLEKAAAAGLTFFLVGKLPWQKVVLLYIVLGQGHFFTAYLYQYKAGKVGRNYLLFYAFCLAAIVLTYQTYPDYAILVAVTTIYFLIHMLFDELYLLRLPMGLSKSPMTTGRFLEMTPILLLYSGRVVEALFPRLSRAPVHLGEHLTSLCWVVLGCYVLLLMAGRHKMDWRSAYFLSWSGFLLYAVYSEWFYQVPTGKLTGFIIIYHYFAWYFHYYLNLRGRSGRKTYVVRVATVNILVVACFLVWGQQGPGKYLFQNDIFYIWTLMHLITSTRPNDLKGLFKANRPSG